MKRSYLGDSYDAVKRSWAQALAEWAPLYTEPRFVTDDIRDEFTRLTGVPMLPGHVSGAYGILNDPDTGIRLPGEDNQSESRTHITLITIKDQLTRRAPRVVTTFDQSDYRHNKLNRDEQRLAKMRYLADAGLYAFYYVSHAPFLFAFPDGDDRLLLRERLLAFGIPDNRFEMH